MKSFFKTKAAVMAAPLVLGLAACQPAARPVTSQPDACGAAGLQGLVGQDASVLAAMALPQGTRIITPGMAVTMDYREDRLNVELDSADKITRVACG